MWLKANHLALARSSSYENSRLLFASPRRAAPRRSASHQATMSSFTVFCKSLSHALP